MKGSEKLREKLPDYQGKRIRKFIIIAFIIFLSSIAFQLFADSLSRIFNENAILQILAPFIPIIGSIIVISIGFTIVYSFWRSRDMYLKKYGDLAYQKAFKFVVTGIPTVISVAFHSFFPSDFIIPFRDSQNLSWYLGTPLFDIFFNFSIVFSIIRLSLSIIVTGFGLIFVYKTLNVFGIDYMALIYVYYPEDSKLQNHEIYSILRHPTYHSLMLISLGSVFLRFSIYSIIFFLTLLIGINIHIKYVEEKELIKRFGEGYKQYKEDVPALFVRLRDIKKYFSFIFKKSIN